MEQIVSKWRRDEKIAVGVVALISATALGLLSAMVINVATAEEIGREAPAKVAYNYCAQWQSAYKRQTCARYATGYETRIVKHMRGSLWDYDTYEVVR